MTPDNPEASFRATVTLQNKDGPGVECLLEVDYVCPKDCASYEHAIRAFAVELNCVNWLLEKMVEKKIKAKAGGWKAKYSVKNRGPVVENYNSYESWAFLRSDAGARTAGSVNKEYDIGELLTTVGSPIGI